MGDSKFFEVRSCCADLVLTLDDDTAEPGRRVNLQKSKGKVGQLWWEDTVANRIRSAKDDSFVLELEDDHLVVQYINYEAYNQNWRLAGQYIRHGEDSDMVLDVPYGNSEDGTDVQMYEFKAKDNQQWEIDYTGRRFCYIRSLMNGKVVDIQGSRSDEGTEILMWDRNDGETPNQLWWEDRYGNIRSKLNDFVFCAREPGHSLSMKEFDPENPDGLWAITGKKIYNKGNPGLVLDIKGSDGDSGTRLCMYEDTGNDNQTWEMVYV